MASRSLFSNSKGPPGITSGPLESCLTTTATYPEETVVEEALKSIHKVLCYKTVDKWTYQEIKEEAERKGMPTQIEETLALIGEDSRLQNSKKKLERFKALLENSEIGLWVGTQRTSYNKGTLAKEKVKMLEEIGFVWKLVEAAWFQKYRELQEFYRKWVFA